MADGYIIYGCGGHARSVAEVILDGDETARLCFVDDQAKPGEKIFGFDVFTSLDTTPSSLHFVALGDDSKRKILSESLNTKLSKIIAKDAHIGLESSIADGCFIGHGAYIGPVVSVGEGTIVNTRAVIEHEVKIGSYSHVAMGVVIAGRAVIGDNVFIGSGSVVMDGLSVCSDVTIGAGSAVIEDIDQAGAYLGVPARRIDE